MKRVRTLRFVAGLVVTSALGGCVYYGWPYGTTTPQWDSSIHWSEWRHWQIHYAGHEPPSPPIEDIPNSPSAGLVWVAGRWRWQNDNFEWVKGSWEKPPAGRSEWIPGRWQADEYGWYYDDGHWR